MPRTTARSCNARRRATGSRGGAARGRRSRSDWPPCAGALQPAFEFAHGDKDTPAAADAPDLAEDVFVEVVATDPERLGCLVWTEREPQPGRPRCRRGVARTSRRRDRDNLELQLPHIDLRHER